MSQFGYTRPYSAAPRGGPTVVYPLGDSLTKGAIPVPDGLGGFTYSYEGGWRSGLFAALTAAGAAPNFIGPQLNSAETPPVTNAGTGHGGFGGASGHNWYGTYWPIYQAGLSATPHLILISVGTNDSDSAAAATDFCRLMDSAAASYPFANILMATAPPTTTPGQFATQAAQVRIEVATRKAMGMHVQLVDVYADAGIIPEDLPDGVHLTRAGYQKMAALWCNAIIPLVT